MPRLIVLLFKSWMRSKLSLFFGLLFPIMLLLVFGSIFGGPTVPSYSLYVRNLDVDEVGNPGFLSEAFIKALNNSVFEVKVLKPWDPAPRPTGFAAIRILTIPRGFTDNVINTTIVNRLDIMAETILLMVEMAGEWIPAEARANMTDAIRGIEAFKRMIPAERKTLILEGSPDDRILQPIEGIIRTIASEFEAALLNASSAFDVQTVYSGVRQLRAVDYYLPGYIAAFVMTNGLIGVSGMVSEMRRSGVIKFLASTPVTKMGWVVSLIVVQVFASLLLTAVMILTGWVVFRISAFPDPFSLLVILLGTLSFTGFGVAVGGWLKEAEAVSALGNSVSFPMMFLSGALWPIELMPPILQEAARYVPLYYFHVALRESMIVGSVSTALAPAAVVAAMAVAAVLLASVAVKWRDF